MILILPNPPLKRREFAITKIILVTEVPLFFKEGPGEIFRYLTDSFIYQNNITD